MDLNGGNEAVNKSQATNDYYTLNLRQKKIKKLMKPSQLEAGAVELLLDENQLQRLDNVENYTSLEKLSISRNQLIRMYGVCRLTNLTSLNLSHNNILSIEGLKELVYLKYLNLSRNSIRSIEHLRSNFHLEHLNLSENVITYITDISFLRELKELLLHGNKINHLKMCNQYLPESLIKLTLANNQLTDLNEISLLTHLINLEDFSIAHNPCVVFIDSRVAFNYRPFIVNWCTNLKTIDSVPINSLEGLKAEWLYSQGKGRHFRIGEHDELTKYLICACPLTGGSEKSCESDDDRKLRLILNKAQQHQQQLKDQLSFSSAGNSPNFSIKRRLFNGAATASGTNSPRSSIKSPNSAMLSSCIDRDTEIQKSALLEKYMSQSLDSSLLRNELFENNAYMHCSYPAKEFQSATKFVPVLESLISPDCPSPNKSIGGGITKLKSNSATKSRPVQRPLSIQPFSRDSTTTVQIKSKPLKDCKKPKIIHKLDNGKSSGICSNDIVDKKRTAAAILIQKTWKGYRVRSLNLLKDIHIKRCQDHLQKLSLDLESTKASLESEKKIQKLQTQALNSIWQKISTQSNADETEIIRELTKSCSFLSLQMEKFQGSLESLVHLISVLYKIPDKCHGNSKEEIATQTDISAVHTPKTVDRIPVWIMRQAGRYLPEFQEIRKKYDFFKICEAPELAAEVTLMPINRFDLDAAIIFSDILVIPQALGMIINMVPNVGPVISNPLRNVEDFDDYYKRTTSEVVEKVEYVGHAIRQARHDLNGKVPLIGFSGGPWTLLGYMVEGGGSKTLNKVKRWLYCNPVETKRALKYLSDVIIEYLKMQIKYGAQAVQLFESSAEYLSPDHFREFLMPNLKFIFSELRQFTIQENCRLPLILFAKGAFHSLAEQDSLDVDVIGLDWTVKPEEARKITNKTLQGNLDPPALYSTENLEGTVGKMLHSFVSSHNIEGYIANLGHGIYPDTPIKSVETFIDLIHNFNN